MILLNLFNKRKRNERHFKMTVEKYFDSNWYKKTYNIVDMDPFEHFRKFGLIDLKNPNKNFDMSWYISEYHDVRDSDVHPFFHYVAFGKNEGRFQNLKEKHITSLEQNTLLAPDSKNNSINLNQFNCEKEDLAHLEYLDSNERGGTVKLEINDNIKVLSFDIWDTVLRRKCHPDEIKLSSARFLYVNYFKKLKPAYSDIVTLFKARKKAEDYSTLTDDYEFRYSDSIDKWLPMVFLSGTSNQELNKIKAELLENEYRSELRSIDVDLGIKKILKSSNQLQLIFASDFYMPEKFINDLLSDKDLAKHFIKGYVSCDLVKNKRSGHMFDHILEDFKIPNKNLLHIGDNKKADYDVPVAKQINAYHYESQQELALNAWFLQAYNETLDHKYGLHNQRIFTQLEKLTKTTDNKIQQIGMRFSPVIIGLILSIIEKAKTLDLKTVYFFTREGIFLKEIYDLVTQADPYHCDYPKSEILEVSRLATFAPSLKAVDQENLMRLWSQYPGQSPQAFCASLNIESKESQQVFREHGFEYHEKIHEPWNNESLAKLLKSYQFKKIVAESIDVQRNLLQKYLIDKGITNQDSDILIVDLGWRGTIQDNIAHLLECNVHGCYLGLMNFLNEQPKNSSKQGYLFDRNQKSEDWNIDEVGPIEMLCNALSGSTIGYKLENSKVIAVKKAEEAEDIVFKNYTHNFQKGIKQAIQPLIDYVAIHALNSESLRCDSREVLSSLLLNPPSIIAQAFFDLTHNETFGTGAYQKMQVDSGFIQSLSKKSGSYLHNYVKKHLQSIRWPEGYLNLQSTQKVIRNLKCDITNVPYDFYKKIMVDDFQNKPKVAIFSPSPLIGSGGHRTLFNLARKLIDAGCELYCFIESEGDGLNAVHDYLGDKKAYVCLGWPETMSFDLAIATIAHSAAHIAKMENVKHKAYLVQDYEAWFNPVGDKYAANETSYTFGLLHFTVGKFLTHVLTHQYRAKAIPSGLGVDNSIYFDKNQERQEAICFLYQPEKDRRNPKLAINALRIVKEKNPDVKIYVYGSDAEIDLDFEVENLGLIRDLAELNDLYNKCKVGLCISMSNPSRIPFEFMSSGVVPVDIYRYNNLLDYPSGTIKLAYQSHASIAEAILQLLNNQTELQSRKISCKDFSYTRSLDWEMDTFVNCALRLMNNQEVDQPITTCDYNDPPVIADSDSRDEIVAFCDWQKRMAEL
ncbi:MAG: hypothetical protein AB8B80_03380 [Marinicellaceae bacterium]